MIARRSLLLGLGSLVASPAIIRVAPLMRIKPVRTPLEIVLDAQKTLNALHLGVSEDPAYRRFLRYYMENMAVYGGVVTRTGDDGMPYVVPFDEWAIA